MITHLFIHATRAVKNIMDKPSRVDAHVNGKPVLVRLLERLQRSTSLAAIHVVTSDHTVDDAIVEQVQSCASNLHPVAVDVLRIPESEPFCIADQNRVINADFLYKKKYYGFYAAECLLKYAAQTKVELAIITAVDDTPMLEPELIDSTLQQHSKKGCLFGFPIPNGSKLYVVPVADLSAKLTVCRYKMKAALQQETTRTQQEIQEILVANPALEAGQLEQNKMAQINAAYALPVHCEDIIKEAHESGSYGVRVLPPYEYQFHPLYTERDEQVLHDFMVKYDTLTLQTFAHSYDAWLARPSHVTPSLLELEVTSRCNYACASCPHTLLNRAETDMTDAMFRSIIDQTAQHVQMLIISGYGEPTLHPDLAEFIAYAKQSGVPRVCIETNGSQLNTEYLRALAKAGLDILLLNIDACDEYAQSADAPGSEMLVPLLLDTRAQMERLRPYIVLQVINRKSRQQQIDYYYKRWRNSVDAVAIQSYNDYLATFDASELINLAPNTGLDMCLKTMNTLVVLADGQPALCKQRFDGESDPYAGNRLSFWLDRYLKGAHYDFCRECLQKYFRDLLVTGYYDHRFSYKLVEKLHRELIPQALAQIEELKKQDRFDDVANLCESILTVDAGNEHIVTAKENMLSMI